MSFKKRVKVPGFGCDFGPLRYLSQLRYVLPKHIGPGEKNRKRFEFNPEVVYLLGILECEFCNLRACKRRPLDEAVMFQFDQRFAYETLADPKLLRELSLDDLFTAPNCA